MFLPSSVSTDYNEPTFGQDRKRAGAKGREEGGEGGCGGERVCVCLVTTMCFG